jgi:hypothetical protein
MIAADTSLVITQTNKNEPDKALGLLWLFASAGALFVYQAPSFLLGYSYGYFSATDLFKVGAILTVIEGIFIMMLVPIYWPLVGLSWNLETPEHHAMSVQIERAHGRTAHNRDAAEGQLNHTKSSSAEVASPEADILMPTHEMDAETTACFRINDSTVSQHFFLRLLSHMPAVGECGDISFQEAR